MKCSACVCSRAHTHVVCVNTCGVHVFACEFVVTVMCTGVLIMLVNCDFDTVTCFSNSLELKNFSH